MMVSSSDAGDSTVETMDLTGGALCLDFVNTMSNRTVGPPRDRLVGYGDLVTWGERTGVLETEGAERLRRLAAREPGEAATVLERARDLRESVYRLFTWAEHSPADLAVVGDAVAAAWAERRLESVAGGYAFGWPESEALKRPLWPVALSAAELLTSEDRARVRECAADDCNWLFLDTSRNRSRRWCDMAVCGNRAKARRFAERRKRGSS